MKNNIKKMKFTDNSKNNDNYKKKEPGKVFSLFFRKYWIDRSE